VKPLPTAEEAVTRAARVIQERPTAVRGSPHDRYRNLDTIVDPDGRTHVRYERTYRGLPVIGGDFIVHHAPGGAFDSVSVRLAKPLTLGTRPSVPAGRAASAAVEHFPGTPTGAGTPRLAVDAIDGVGRLVWETVVNGVAPDGQTPSVLHVLTDAHTNAVTTSFDEVRTVASTARAATAAMAPAAAGIGYSIYSGDVTIDTTLSGGVYSMVDPSHGNGSTCDMNNGTTTCTTFTDPDNIWGNGHNGNRQSAGVDAHYGAAVTYDYFKNVHGRNGIFGDGRGVPSRVHFGNDVDNAFWDGVQMTYGDDERNETPWVALDIAGHEMSHGVTGALAGLLRNGEPGGLDEATSDIFGSMVEFYADNPADPADYMIGEKVAPYGNGTALRYMYDPSLDGASHSCWSPSTAGVDVHFSSGVGNHFFFMLAEGSGGTAYGTSPVCHNAPAVSGIGRGKAERIWYRALSRYFVSTTDYWHARQDTLNAARDLYGLCGVEYRAVQAAWKAVDVVGPDPVCTVQSAADLNLMFNAYGNAGGHWTGGDGTVSVRLPDVRTA